MLAPPSVGRKEQERLRDYLCRYYDLDERLQAVERQSFYSLEVELTNRCNQECLYCYNTSLRKPLRPELRESEIRRWIREAAAARVREFYWLGGEPLTYPGIEGILEFSAELGMKNTVLTNGTLLTQDKWQRLRPLISRLVYHLDTVQTSTYCEINNVTLVQGERLLRRAIDNLEAIREEEGSSGIDVILYVVLLQPTLSTLRDTLEWAFANGLADTSALYPMVRAGRGREAPRSWTLSPRELREGFELRAEVEERPELLLLGPSEYCKHYQMTMAYIDVEGKLSPYAGITEPRIALAGRDLGRLLRECYAELSFTALGWPNPSQGLQEPCKGCEQGEFCFGTRTTAFNHLGDVGEADPFCWVGAEQPLERTSNEGT